MICAKFEVNHSLFYKNMKAGQVLSLNFFLDMAPLPKHLMVAILLSARTALWITGYGKLEAISQQDHPCCDVNGATQQMTSDK